MIGKMLMFGFMFTACAMGQTATGSPSAVSMAMTATPEKTYGFEVVTMRPNPSSPGSGVGKFGPTPNGYSVKNMSLRNIVLTAFAPQTGSSVFYTSEQIKGMPDWAASERYDIEARVSEKDRAEWQDPQSQKKMLQSMLQNLLADRCKLAAHREVKMIKILSLELAKSGPKFKESTPGEAFPAGIKMPWGGVVRPTATGMEMYGTTMASFATVLTERAGSGYPIQDKTGLKGTYDITLKAEVPTGSPVGGAAGGQADMDAAMLAAVDTLGLKLVPTKSETETLTIDHLDHPAEN